MKNLNYLLSGILGIAVIVLFILHFSSKPISEIGNQKSTTWRTDSSASMDGANIAYIRIDSVLSNWNLYFEMQEELEAKQQKLSSDFDSKSQSFMKRVEDAQYRIQRGLVTRGEAEELQQQLSKEEQTLMGLQNDYTTQMQEEGVVKNRQMIDKLEQYLKEYNKTKGYDFIFSYSFGGNLLYAEKGHDISEEIINGLNEEYPSKKE